MSVILQAPELTFRRLDKKLFPASIVARNKFLKFLNNMVSSRVQRTQYLETASEKTKGNKMAGDIFSLFQNARDPETGKGFGIEELSGESATLIVAGSDTTSTTLAGVFYYLGQNQDIYDRVAAEVRATFADAEEIRMGPKLSSCTFLRSCVNETLRMSPPTGSALWREVCSGGANVAGHFIPAGCDVGVGIYAIHHNSKYFPEPLQFRPDRWSSHGVGDDNGGENGKQTDDQSRAGSLARQAFMPFSIGTRGCIGKGLATLEIMLTMATILWKSDFRRANNLPLVGEYPLRDHITASKQGPMLQFRLRK